MGDCIVDACVLHGAGTSAAIDSVRVREVLDALLEERHVLVVNEALWQEWQLHLSSYSRVWLSDMASRGFISFVSGASHHCAGVSRAISMLPVSQRPVAEKDEHLLRLSLSANALVISSETACRAAFVSCGSQYAPISGIYWVSPLLDPQLPVWLRARTAPLHSWLLV